MSEIDKHSFLTALLKKQAYVQGVQEETGANTEAASKEVKRQIHQVSIQSNGDPITGTGVTKSGEND